MRPVIEKELLHYDILYALDEARVLDNLVFQGGTSQRLCENQIDIVNILILQEVGTSIVRC